MNKKRQNAAKIAADFIRSKFNIPENPIGLILGTGWGNAIDLGSYHEVPFSEIPGLEKVQEVKGHKRSFIVIKMAEKTVVIISGRIHMNESPNASKIAKMVRLQTEILCQLGAKTIIATCAAGALEITPILDEPGTLNVGDIAVIDGFVSLYAGGMPLWGNEFCSPEDAISKRLNKVALTERGELVSREVGYAMFHGPHFEGRKYDKKILSQGGAGAVGMSMLPEACVASLYEAEFLGLCFITNSDKEVHSHEENIRRANESSSLLGTYLERIISQV